MHHIVVAYRGALRSSLCCCFSAQLLPAVRLTYISVTRCCRSGGDGIGSALSVETVFLLLILVFALLSLYMLERNGTHPPCYLFACVSELRLMGLPSFQLVLLWNPE